MANSWEPDLPDSSDKPQKADTLNDRNRRQWIKGVVGAVVVGTVGYFGWTRFFFPPGSLRPGMNPNATGIKPGQQVALGQVTDFTKSADPVQVTVDGQVAFVDFTNGYPKVVSGVCTHQGCAVAWNTQQNLYVCPCHNSAFARDGKVVRGPATKPLPKYQSTIEGTTVYAVG